MCEHISEILNDPWAVFAESIDRNPSDLSLSDGNIAPTLEHLWSSRRRISDSKWRWLCDICDVLEGGYDCEFGQSFDSLVVKFRFAASEYSIRMLPSSDFPESPPEVNSSLGDAFELNWNEDSTLLSICNEYGDQCSLLDVAVMECSEVDYPLKFIAWRLHPDEVDCITVELSLLDEEFGGEETRLTLVVEWHSPRSFPRSIYSSKPNRLRSVSFDRWDTSLSFGESLQRLFVRREDVDAEYV
uniref:Uncharacterized protein n=2 Tax=Parascaris univalens TaxID=6257 RepID=A0A915BH72_PARUN